MAKLKEMHFNLEQDATTLEGRLVISALYNNLCNANLILQQCHQQPVGVNSRTNYRVRVKKKKGTGKIGGVQGMQE